MGLLDSFKALFAAKPKHKLGPKVSVAKRFDLIGRTGQGSMSKVWRAYDRELGRNICLKLLDKEKTAKFEARFIGMQRPHEGEICMALKHPNIVRTFEYGITTENEQYIVMELIKGVGLNYLVDTHNKRLAGKRLTLLGQIAEGVEYLHKQRYLHRDLCPRNIMVTEEEVVKLIDFGLTIPYTPEFCKPGNRTGTPDYLAPEIIKRMPTDHRVDMFALGVTAFELLTGALPWEKDTSQQTLLSHMNTPARDPREVKKDLDKRTADFLLKAVQREPRDRFQTATEFREALERLPKS